jgi:hypothetical protein
MRSIFKGCGKIVHITPKNIIPPIYCVPYRGETVITIVMFERHLKIPKPAEVLN